MKHLVIGNMKHDGKRQKVGAQVELDDATAARLTKGGFVVPLKNEAPAASAEGDEGDGDGGKGGDKGGAK